MIQWGSYSPSAIYLRHEGHLHTINIKYGYYVLLISAIHAGLIILQSYLQTERWRKDGVIGNQSPWIRVFLMVSAWSIIFLVMSVWAVDFHSDHITVFFKRCGRLSMALLPFNIFLVLRLANPTFNFFNYLGQINLHKWISRLVIVFSTIHSIGFLIKWTIDGVLITKITDKLNALGIVVFISSVLLLVISLRYFRRRIYKYFYLWHNVTVWGFVIIIGFHARPGVFLYAVACMTLLAFQIFNRFSDQEPIDLPQVIRDMDPDLDLAGRSNLVIVRIPKIYIAPWSPGSHVRIQLKSWQQYFFPSHPYTIASTIDDPTLDLVVRESNNFQFNSDLFYYLTGPYPVVPEPFFQTAEKVCIICGGSGISFGLPIIKGIRNTGNHASVKLIWCVRNIADTYILKYLGLDETIQVYVTGGGSAGSSSSNSNLEDVTEGLLGAGAGSSEVDDSFEMESLLQSIEHKGRNLAHVRRGRPDFDEIFSSLNESETKSNQWLIACGPEGLVVSARKWSKVHKIPFMSEIYEM